ncbi:MAG: RNA pseudouridine synthase [Firmicutes bacterium HGW-Firmicutes-20]|jgi:23S rRNA pseudouridine1911/1915/1917 synthase|nr:MAG: RNA pseudouridine synthase [Firmicutes bacterium HGW-Firmicutes-20]PKM69521.1 MAG: RNA pseudouridine synthase [Firmicutes bacterium HGW-Firmicutes-19]
MEQFEFIVALEDAKTRIDQYLTAKLPYSRSRIQSLINQGYILLNDEETKSNTKVKIGDEIVVDVPEAESIELKPVDLNLEIVYEDSDIIVVNKPKGMIVHPGAGTKEPTLVEGLLYHCKDLSGINGALRPGIVHRIDKDTSGLLVAAKNDLAHQSLSQQLSSKTMHRSYLGVVHGVVEPEVATIDAPIGRDIRDRQKMMVTDINARNAITHFRVLQRFKDFTYVEFELETGRTHQIRVHMQYIKHPMMGDPKYANRNTPDTQGQMLHAYKLTLVHPKTQQTMTFTCDVPEIFKTTLEELQRRGD